MTEECVLRTPVHRQPLQPLQQHRLIGRPREDSLDDLGLQQQEAQDTADIRAAGAQLQRRHRRPSDFLIAMLLRRG
jgi:hypothetical protein